MCEINLEAELFTLQDSNAKLVAALQEANSGVEHWKKQLAEYQEETDRLRDQVDRHSVSETLHITDVVTAHRADTPHTRC